MPAYSRPIPGNVQPRSGKVIADDAKVRVSSTGGGKRGEGLPSTNKKTKRKKRG